MPTQIMGLGRNRKSRHLNAEEEKFFRQCVVRATSTHGQPYIARALFKLVPISAPGLRTMGVDKFWRVYIDFEYMMDKGIPYAAGVLAHEPWHLLRNHEERGVQFRKPEGFDPDPAEWGMMTNIAGDLEINDDIRNLIPADSIFPRTGTFRSFPEELTMEQYLKMLIENPEIAKKFLPKQGQGQPQQGQPQQGQPGQGNPGKGQPGPGAPGQGQPGNGQPQPGQGGGKPDPNGQPGGGSGKGDDDHLDTGENTNLGCGVGGESALDDYLIPDGTEGVDEVSSIDIEVIKNDVADEIESYQRAHGIGSVPGAIAKWAGDTLKHSSPDWRQILRATVKSAIAWKAGQVDYVRSRPARRQPIPKVVLPALRAPKPTIGVAIDTSGSNLHQLGLILDELEKIMKGVGVRGPQIKAFSVDVAVASKIVPVMDPKKVLDQGRLGGGTRMTPGYIQLGKLGQDINILFTDGYVDDFPMKRPVEARGNTKFITCVVVPKGPHGDGIIQAAEKNLGSWGSVVPIYVEDI